MIARVWHGYTDQANAKDYEELLLREILPSIEQSHECKTQLFVRPLDNGEVEFITTCYFRSIDEIKRFAGEDYERCVVPPKARALLKRFDERSKHYQVRR